MIKNEGGEGRREKMCDEDDVTVSRVERVKHEHDDAISISHTDMARPPRGPLGVLRIHEFPGRLCFHYRRVTRRGKELLGLGGGKDDERDEGTDVS